ncbi:MAG: radical SAM protein [Candidatus Omnitrophica bacterium]|nr:radical SAM protein [Candidatus Omnitrophota bacterium]
MKASVQSSILPFNAEKINDKYLVTNMMGCWDALTCQEFRQLNRLDVPEDGLLFKRLREKGLIVDEDNLQSVIEAFRRMNAHLFNDTGLHIAVVTKRCNLRCKYCHARGGFSTDDMSMKTAARVLQYLFDVRNNSVTLEFQGGEPLLNWPVVKFMTQNARKFNTLGKKLSIVLVSNLLLMDDAKARFLAAHEVDVCTSMDGPADIHDKNRLLMNGAPTHARLLDRVQRYIKVTGRKVHMLPTITRHSLQFPERIIDEYLRLGQREIPLRPVNSIGSASLCWDEVGYSAEEFNVFYDRALAYILKLNISGRPITERTARSILSKVLLKTDPGMVDMMNPCGAGRAVMTYDTDGTCFPTDEARMVKENIFQLGNIMDDPYDKMIAKENLFFLLSAGCSDLWNYNSVMSPWLGIDPVVHYAKEGNVIPQAASRLKIILEHQCKTVFRYLLKDKKYDQIFKNWVSGESPLF